MTSRWSVPPKARVFWPVLGTLLLADFASKQMIVERLRDDDPPVQVVGDLVRFVLAYNPGAAMSISLGTASRWGFSLLAIGVITWLIAAYRRLRPDDASIALALAFVCGGAAGNLLDRLRSDRGVVDFIDIGVGVHRFYVFNVADVGVTVGMALLVALLWRRDRRAASAETVVA